jgi:hypothetical protein
MKLEQMRTNFLNLTQEEQQSFVQAYRAARAQDFLEKEQNKAIKEASSTRLPPLSEDEKQLCKLLKITQKQFREIKASQMEITQ